MNRNLYDWLLFAFSLLPLLLYCDQPKQPVQVKNPFSWLEGQWEVNQDTLHFYESWTTIDSVRMDGSGLVMSGSDTIMTEKLRIERVNGSWVYIGGMQEYKPVMFTLTGKPEGTEYRFENPDHPYPRGIVYRHDSDSAISAEMYGTNYEGKEVKETYVYRRMK